MLRLRPWQTWPVGRWSVQQNLQVGPVEALVELSVTGYGEQDQGALDISPIMWRPEVWAKSPHMMGSKIILQPGSSTAVVAESITKARPGEIDVICFVATNEEPEWSRQLLISMVYAVSASLGIALNDTFQMAGPVATRKAVHQQREPLDSPPFDLEVRVRNAMVGTALPDPPK